MLHTYLWQQTGNGGRTAHPPFSSRDYVMGSVSKVREHNWINGHLSLMLRSTYPFGTYVPMRKRGHRIGNFVRMAAGSGEYLYSTG